MELYRRVQPCKWRSGCGHREEQCGKIHWRSDHRWSPHGCRCCRSQSPSRCKRSSRGGEGSRSPRCPIIAKIQSRYHFWFAWSEFLITYIRRFLVSRLVLRRRVGRGRVGRGIVSRLGGIVGRSSSQGDDAKESNENLSRRKGFRIGRWLLS